MHGRSSDGSMGGDVMASKSISLNFVWGIYLKLWAEGNKLRAEGDALHC